MTDNYFLSIDFTSTPFIFGFFEHFQIYAVNNLNGTGASVVAQYSGVYAMEHVKYFYLSQVSDYTASIESAGNISKFISVYPLTLSNPNNIYTVGAAVILYSVVNYAQPRVYISKELAAGYYFVFTSTTTTTDSVTLKWITNAYTCPYHSDFPDYMQHFQGCTNPAPTNTPIPTQQLPDAFSYDFTTTQSLAASKPFKYPIYSLGSIAAGKTIGIKLALVGADSNAAPISNFTIQVIRGTPDGAATDLSALCSNAISACSAPYTTPAADNYYLAVFDANSADPFVKKYLQWFLVEVIDDITATTPATLLKISDVFRDRVVKYIFIDPAQTTSFTLAPVITGNTDSRDLELFAMSGSGNIFPVGTAQVMGTS